MHNEYFYDRSPNAALNNLNQLEYWGANLWDLEHAPGCQPITRRRRFQPCPVDNYHTGGFGLVKKYTGVRWIGRAQVDPPLRGGRPPRAQVRLAPRVRDASTRTAGTRARSGSRALDPALPAAAAASTPTPSSRCSRASSPSDFGTAACGPPPTCSTRPHYQDNLKAYVKSIVNAFFLQDSYSPHGLRNLTVNAGARLELQKLYDFHGNAFLDATQHRPARRRRLRSVRTTAARRSRSPTAATTRRSR